MYLTIGGKIQAIKICRAIAAGKCFTKGQADPDNQRPDKWSANERQRVKEERNKKRKAKWKGHFLCTNCLLKSVIE